MMKNIDADYYGYRDDDDGILIPLEKVRSNELEKEAKEKWLATKDNDTNMETNENDIILDEPMVSVIFLTNMWLDFIHVEFILHNNYHQVFIMNI